MELKRGLGSLGSRRQVGWGKHINHTLMGKSYISGYHIFEHSMFNGNKYYRGNEVKVERDTWSQGREFRVVRENFPSKVT